MSGNLVTGDRPPPTSSHLPHLPRPPPLPTHPQRNLGWYNCQLDLFYRNTTGLAGMSPRPLPRRNYDFISVFHCNCASITYRFRQNEVLLLTRIIVKKNVHQDRGAAHVLILKERLVPDVIDREFVTQIC